MEIVMQIQNNIKTVTMQNNHSTNFSRSNLHLDPITHNMYLDIKLPI